MENKCVILTGATSGLGLEVLKDLNKRNIYTICLVRNTIKLEKAIIENSLNKDLIESYYYDQSKFETIDDLTNSLSNISKNIYAVIFNSGIYYPKEKLEGNINKTIKVNYLGTYKLFMVLKNINIITKDTKVLFVTSITSKFVNTKVTLSKYNHKSNNNYSYSYSKALINEFAYKMIKEGYDVTLCDPGVFRSNILSSNDSGFSNLFVKLGNLFLKLFLPNVKSSKQSVIYPLFNKTKHRYIKPKILNIYGRMKDYKIPKRFDNDNIIYETNEVLSNIK